MDAVADALEPVVRDVRSSLTSIVDAAAGPAPLQVLLHGQDGTVHECFLDPDTTPAARMMDVADHVQDLLHDLLHASGALACWPECPWHPAGHPLRPEPRSGTPSWCCPASGRVVAPIGDLRASGRP